MTTINHNKLFLVPFVLGSVLGCASREIIHEEESAGLATQALVQSDIVVCTGACAEQFGGTPSSRFPVYYATTSVKPPNGADEITVSAAFLMKCGANRDVAFKAFGFDSSSMDSLDVYEDLEVLMSRLGNRAPVEVDCKTSPFSQVFRRVDATHSEKAPAYYVQVKQALIDEAAAKGEQRPPAIYALDCGNPLNMLWQSAPSTQALHEVLSAQATPINGAVLKEWTETRRLSIPTLFCGIMPSYRIELPAEPPKNTRTVARPANPGVELYLVYSSFDGVSNASKANYLITNGLGYAIDGCGAHINELQEALGLVPGGIPVLSPTDPKFIASNPNRQPVLRCTDTKMRVFASLNAPRSYRYFSFGASNLTAMVRFASARTEQFFLDNLVNQPEPVLMPEESLAYLSGTGEQGKIYDIGFSGGSCVLGKAILGACILN